MSITDRLAGAILGLPLCYVGISNGLIILQKYFIAIILFLTTQLSIIGLAGLLSATQSTPFEAFRLETIIVSLITTAVGVIETVFMKDRMVEMAITA
ncbi:MAG: hypothetical protein FGF51_00780 [Candidatus Brockarchaeota archaeon]|nr:hypothetical protein [Candidatus Brockarchaeota archaeon]MBO3831909.1 hypothetical protein [Candidatus Brockarchaeota archaeon]